MRDLLSRLADIPPVTAGNLALSLLALPLIALLGERVVEIGPIAELAVQWGLVAAVVGVAVSDEDQSFAEIGFRRPTWGDLGYTLATAVAALLVFAGTDPVVEALGLPVAGDAGTMTAGVGVGVALARVVTTGIVEEILFRGYPIERLVAYTGSPLVAGGLTWGVFTFAHAAVWPAGNLLQVAAVAAVLTAVYLRRRTLFPVIGAHVLVWALSVMGQYYG
ncbi:CPBP family intramembrane glutamic endopeptidase [Salinibacter ruber]|jgi:membrane protease YdiL (CAAX protease family)|uniref:CPBP family intramembrane glutamic endopeptidase n=1 Tax=Salinibacter ruber TaxID=146919 RepID=UPI00216734C1|nr:CPBP family intramembrane glutamic endopeptidase [Salinibacter ruber]MCS3658078.1 membrane protease YdiL (CAAX protease family) [Salinibacter ruber]MCS3685875.1 membrane protease YdiL (CAAX protease family) [Salinibacter ruber]MCS3698453.1 membrane protease YdiL (CAAX protease family) [Salinibacter ruber]MCS4171983.1 membrane protease YdiL (CAAX protease family) [Salinibacter ruber]MCS4185828.1 membrane protease YdiL (CAAX protease family) [Salinibacter ruber]